MMTATVATVVTATKVHLKVMMRKVLASLTETMSAVVKCPRCFWHDNNSICSICDYDIPAGLQR